jgi:hypothetical protein
MPSFQLYPGDWLRDPQLQSTSYEVRGIWFQVLCNMHFEPQRGVLYRPLVGLLQLLGLDQAAWERFSNAVRDYGFCDLEVNGDGEVTLRSRRMMRDERERKQHNSRQRRYRDAQDDGEVTPEVTVRVTPMLHHSSSSSPIPFPDPEIRDHDLCNGSLSLNGTSAPCGAHSHLPLELKAQEPEPKKLTPEDLAEGWNNICVPVGLPKIVTMDKVRRRNALARIAESYEHARAYGETVEDYWGHVLTNISQSAWCRGLRPSPDHKDWKADIDFLVANSTRPLRAREGKYV